MVMLFFVCYYMLVYSGGYHDIFYLSNDHDPTGFGNGHGGIPYNPTSQGRSVGMRGKRYFQLPNPYRSI
jgi:hypothetical protein